MTKSNKRPILIYIIGLLLLAVVVVYIFFATRTSQTDMTVDRISGKLSEVPFSDDSCFVTAAPGLRFCIDTGSDVSYISESDLALLESMGYKARKSFYPVLGRNVLGEIELSCTRYTVDVPAYCWTEDSVPRPIEGTKNVFRNVDFAPSPTDYSVLGSDFFEHFMLEHRVRSNNVALYINEPRGYEQCQVLEKHVTPFSVMMLGNRYYVKMSVDDRMRDYFIDTGMGVASTKHPLKDTISIGAGYSHSYNQNIGADKQNAIMDTVVRNSMGYFNAKMKPRCWVRVGPRQGRVRAFYLDNNEEPYAANPINMLEYNMVLDFINGRILFQ